MKAKRQFSIQLAVCKMTAHVPQHAWHFGLNGIVLNIQSLSEYRSGNTKIFTRQNNFDKI
jgi:hypothetical protein